jgi:hypothetical protein
MYYPFGAKTYNLGSSISSTATTILLSSFTEPVTGTPYTMALLNTDIVYGTIAPKTTSSEFISFTGITQNANGTATLTGVTRGLAKKYPFIESTAYKLPHAGQSQFIISDAPQVFVEYGALENDEVITGLWEAPDPLTAQGLVTRDYMLNLINGGTISVDSVVEAGNAGETLVAGNLIYFSETDNEWLKTDADTLATVFNVKLGIAMGAGTNGGAITNGVLTYGTYTTSGLTGGDLCYASNTAGGINSGTAGTTPRVIGIAKDATHLSFDPYFQDRLYDYAVDSVGTDSYAVTLAGAYNNYYDGMEVAFKVGTANTGTCTLNVNGLGAKTLKKNVSSDLITGDILTNQIIIARYDGTNFQIVSALADNPITPTIQKFTESSTTLGDSTTRFDITNPAGTTFRYTWDGTGTDPGITAITVPTGIRVLISSATTAGNIAAANIGNFIVTGSGVNYFEVTNASGSAENDKIIGTNGSLKTITAQTWTKPANLKYVVVEGVGAGGGGGGTNSDGSYGNGGGGGGYFRKIIANGSLSATETVYVGPGGSGGVGDANGFVGTTSYFTNSYYATAGSGGMNSGLTYVVGAGGIGVGGDINIEGGDGGNGGGASTVFNPVGGTGGNSYFGGGGMGGKDSNNNGNNGNLYGGGGGGAGNPSSSTSGTGGTGAGGIVTVTEYY